MLAATSHCDDPHLSFTIVGQINQTKINNRDNLIRWQTIQTKLMECCPLCRLVFPSIESSLLPEQVQLNAKRWTIGCQMQIFSPLQTNLGCHTSTSCYLSKIYGPWLGPWDKRGKCPEFYDLLLTRCRLPYLSRPLCSLVVNMPTLEKCWFWECCQRCLASC